MRAILPFVLFILVFVAIDLYAFKALKMSVSGWETPMWRYLAYAGYLVSSLVVYSFIAYAVYRYNLGQKVSDYYFFFMSFGLLMLIFMPKLVVAFFHLFDDLIHLFRKIATYFIRTTSPDTPAGMGITRWQFLTRIGWVLAAIPFVSILYGIGRGRYQFRTMTERMSFDHLPAWASGLRVVHISDIHIGSFFNNHEAVAEGVAKVNALKPDLILFTGDMVNNYAEELEGWEPVLSKLKARYGKYSIMGNHDYGDYVKWSSAEAREANIKRLHQYHGELGFKLLLNENVKFAPEGESEPLEIIGVENWGQGGFSKYGKLGKAMEETDSKRFQILMSHDPSHWDAEVRGDTAVDLTLAGHTHGMQFGVEIPGIVKWSPVKYRYPRWGGLYTEGSQHVYVNRGFGYIGFPGRVGMAPEITLIELSKA
ncbi:MAG: metallophosphoesterase [Cryomorphaceae bacterium]